jgi:hypothetical protein
MQPLLDGKKHPTESEKPIPTDDLEKIISVASILRISVSDDVGTKRWS